MKRYLYLIILIAAAMFMVSCGDKRTEQGTEAGSQAGTGEFPSTENGQQEETGVKVKTAEREGRQYIVIDRMFLEMDKTELQEAYINALCIPRRSARTALDEVLYLPEDPFEYIVVRSTEIVLDKKWLKEESGKEATEADRYFKYCDLTEELAMPFLEEVCRKYGLDPASAYAKRRRLTPTVYIENVDRDTIKRMLDDETIELFIDPFRTMQD